MKAIAEDTLQYRRTAEERWTTQYRFFHNCHNVHKACLKQLIETVNSKCLDSLNDEVVGFENINLVDMLKYL